MEDNLNGRKPTEDDLYSIQQKLWTTMEILCVTPDNYSQHIAVMEESRRYRAEHIWPVETDLDLMDHYREQDAKNKTFVAWDTQNNTFVGMTQWDGVVGRVRQVGVASSWRGRGIGGHLVDLVATQARNAGWTSLLVHCWVASSGFYKKLGFIKKGEVYISGDKQVECQHMTLLL